MSHTTEHNIWLTMRARCNNPNVKSYPRYGGAGVRVCQRWEESFENFLADMGARPSLQHSLDRFPIPGGNYEPGNVRWATCEEQGSNKKNNVNVELHGVTKTMSQWARHYGIKPSVVRNRFWCGWSAEEAITTPLGHRRRG